MSADLDAIDRGLVDVGLTAAEALARVVALEAQMNDLDTQMSKVMRAAFRLGVETGLNRARCAPQADHPRHLSAVPPIGESQ